MSVSVGSVLTELPSFHRLYADVARSLRCRRRTGTLDVVLLSDGVVESIVRIPVLAARAQLWFFVRKEGLIVSWPDVVKGD